MEDMEISGETALKKELNRTKKKITENRKEILKRHLKFPVLNPTFYAAVVSFVVFFGLQLFLTPYINSVGIQIAIIVLLPFMIVLIALFWGDIPEENIKNGVATIEVKQETLTLKRHQKILNQVLSKPSRLRGKDESILLRFESLES